MPKCGYFGDNSTYVLFCEEEEKEEEKCKRGGWKEESEEWNIIM